MENQVNGIAYELLCVIVNFGLGSKVLKTAKQSGVSGGTVFLGKGTIKNHLLELLGLYDIRKEIVLTIAEKKTVDKALEDLNKKFNFAKPNHGIAFTTSVANIIGARNCIDNKLKASGGGTNPMHNAIFTIVDRGMGETVVEAAEKAGSRGATIIHARGSGIHENSKLFSMVVEPEKDIVLILAEESLTEGIVASIRETLKIDKPGHGIIFVLDINKTYGLY